MNAESTVIGASAAQPALDPSPTTWTGQGPDEMRWRVSNDTDVVITIAARQYGFDAIRAEILGLTILAAAKKARLQQAQEGWYPEP